MIAIVSALKSPALLGLSLFAASCATAQPSDASPQMSPSEKTQLILKKGQYLSITIPQAKTTEEAKKARQQYYKTAFPLGAKFGLKREASLNIDEVTISDYQPTNLIFFSYPDKQSEAKLAGHSQWPAIKASRPQIWEELNIFSTEVLTDMAISFDAKKSYTLVIAWEKDGNAEDYEKYLNGIEPAMKRFGGRFIYKMRNPALESNQASAPAPSQLTFVEWDSLDGFSKVQKSDEYKASVPYFQSGVSKLEFYRMSVAK